MKKNILFVGFFLFLCAPTLRAQVLSAGNLMGPGAPPAMIGVELGLGEHTQNGSFQASCSCTFASGSGSGFLGGLLFELPVDYEWTFGLGVKFDFKTYSSTTTVIDTATVTYTGNDTVSSGYLPVERDGSVKETFMTLAPFVRYELVRNGPFVQVGPGIEFLLSSSFTHTRVLNSTTITLTPENGGNAFTINNVRFQNGTRQEVLQSGKIVNVNPMRISAMATVGWNLSVGENAVLAPMITYDFPFTTVRNDFVGPDGASGWKITSIYFSVGLKYKLD